MKVLLADDHQLFIEGLEAMLLDSADFSTVVGVTNGRDALAQLLDAIPPFDMALIDLRLPGLDGLGILDHANRAGCLTPVVVISASEHPADAHSAMERGAMAYISKSASSDLMLDIIRRVNQGEVVPPQNGNGSLPTATEARHLWAESHGITRRQLEVLELMQQGLSNKEIADRLFLGLATVKTHAGALFRALDARNRTDAIRRARQLGLD